MCKGKENSFVGEYNGASFITRLDVNGNKVEDKIVNIKIKIENAGIGAYKCTITYSDQPNPTIILGFKDNNNTIVSSTSSGNGIVYIYFDGNKLRHKISSTNNDGNKIVRVSELKKVKNNDCYHGYHDHHGLCGCKH